MEQIQNFTFKDLVPEIAYQMMQSNLRINPPEFNEDGFIFIS